MAQYYVGNGSDGALSISSSTRTEDTTLGVSNITAGASSGQTMPLTLTKFGMWILEHLCLVQQR